MKITVEDIRDNCMRCKERCGTAEIITNYEKMFETMKYARVRMCDKFIPKEQEIIYRKTK